MSDRTIDHYAEILRSDFASFAQRAFRELYPARTFENNWHIDLLAEKLEAVRRGKIQRLIINVPPRSLKSFLGSTAFPAFILGHHPSAEVLCVSYGQDFAQDLALPCRSIMQAPFYQALFETRLSDDRQAVEEFKTTAGGARRAVSWAGAVLGRGADFIIIDDPMKVEDAVSENRRNDLNESFHTSIATRLNRDTGGIVLIMQRLHANDLTAFVQKNEKWDVVAIPAIAERDERHQIQTPFGRRTIVRKQGEPLQSSRQSLKYLEERKQAQGVRTFDAQYQQKPHAAEGAVIKREWLKFYDDNTKPVQFDSVIQSWDTASKPSESNSFSVCTTWGIRESNFYLLDVVRDRFDFRALKQTAIGLARSCADLTTILVEEQSSGSPLMSELEQLDLPVQAAPPSSASKAQRLYAHSNKFESGRVLLPRSASWLDVYLDELTSFPDSDFSDQVDSTSQALTWDTANTRFNNAVRTMGLLAGRQPPNNKSKNTIKLQVLPGGGGTVLQFHDGSGREDIHVPGPGTIFEIDKDIGYKLAQDHWTKYRVIPD